MQPAVLSSALDELGPLERETKRALSAIATWRDFEAGAYLLEAGQGAEWMFLVERGLVREFYLGEAGEEHTRNFMARGQITGSLVDLLSGEPALTFIQALEDTRTLAWRYCEFNALTARFPDLERAARRNAEDLAVHKTLREHELLALSAAERHERWLAEHPDIDARLSRRMVASYLGITPVHLSRLRAAARRR